jgi:hypothetical protein
VCNVEPAEMLNNEIMVSDIKKRMDLNPFGLRYYPAYF